MSTIETRMADIAAGPSGPRVAAFFDFDGTLIDGYSVTGFYKHRLFKGEIGLIEASQLLRLGLRGLESEADFAAFATQGFRAWAGTTEADMDALGEQLFVKRIAGCLYPQAWRLIDAHRRMGHTLVIASSATRFQVQAMARELGVEHVLCTTLEARDGVLTGRMSGSPPWGDGKARAVRRFASRHHTDLALCYAYANGDEDVPFLKVVGQPCAVNPQDRLARVALERAWPVLRFAPRAGRPDAVTMLRSVAAYAGMAGAMFAGLGVGLLNGSRRDAVNLTSTLAGDVGLAIAGIELRTQGETHLWAQRPAIFVFNHQSQLDLLILAKLLRHDFTGIAKMSTKQVPGFGQFFQFAGVAFVEPGAKAQNRAALAPAVEKLKGGISLVMAPEGTRSATPRLGPFRKGAFHLALQARVPMVPIVIRNAGELMRRGEAALRPGTVDVAVLAPISTARWKASDIERHMGVVRQRFVDTLENWPRPAALPPVTTANARKTARRAKQGETG